MSETGKLRMNAAGDHRVIYIVYILKSHTGGRRLISEDRHDCPEKR